MRTPFALLFLNLCWLSLFTPPSEALQDRSAGRRNEQAWIKLSCHGVKQAQIDSDEKETSATKVSDTMEIVRRSKTLLVTINGEQMKQAMKRDGYATDIYNIANDGKDGLAAIHGYPLYPTAHSLVVDSAGTLAIWTEVGLTFYSSVPKPTSTTILFSCRR